MHIAATLNSPLTHSVKHQTYMGDMLPLLFFVLLMFSWVLLHHFPLTMLMSFVACQAFLVIRLQSLIGCCPLPSFTVFLCAPVISSTLWVIIAVCFHSVDKAVSGAVWADAEGKETNAPFSQDRTVLRVCR